MIGLKEFSTFEVASLFGVLGIALLGLYYAFYLRRQILSIPLPEGKMREVWGGIKEGAEAYLASQWRIIRNMIGVLVVVLFLSVWVVQPSAEATEVFGANAKIIVAVGRALAFLAGAIFSAMVGRLGMRMAIDASIRVADLASKEKAPEALKTAYRAGTVTGMLTDGLGLLGGTLIFISFGKAAPDALLGFGFGGTLLALLMRVGGGIYTKAADVGADLVGKIEAGIPEDDPRNPAVVADLVGDNVGDCAGMAADIFESYEVTIVSSLILGLALASLTGSVKWIVFPLIVRGIGVLSSIIGTAFVKSRNNENPLHTINRGFYTSAAISVVLFSVLAQFYMHEWRAFGSVVIGVILAIVIDHVTGYFTDGAYAPVKKIAEQTKSGAATTILSGLSTGLESSVWSALVIALTIVGAIAIYSGFPPVYVLYGVSLTGIGMLTLTGNNVAMDSFGPISDNAGGIGEMAKIDSKGQAILARLDAAGNTTKAITKGVAIGSAVIAAVSLFGSFITDVEKVRPGTLASGIRVSEPLVFVGLLIGGALPLLFSSRLIDAVSRAASSIIADVRRQFRIPGILEGTVKPDYATTVAICTKSAQKELLPIALLAVLSSVLVGLLFGVEPLGGFLAGLILSGQLLAVFMSNAGGAWDNAKKYVEEGNFGGKGSEAHKASIVGDTVGDPLKDTAGPALNPLLKVINLISVIIAPLLVMDINPVVKYGIAAVILGSLAWLLFFQKGDFRKKAFAQE
ncbi:MAG: K(+)-insensitive pyrophosphate-energized proton pump [candidate division WWE3 bacterium GW2011_GWF2_41_45]|uniref:K(+)-insensitive pyrophosphate-energized proton pump n=2 Tax=Katanobacteria TaxID=422282 RepID=A0A1F4W2D1_UNCKA|nr:MAG: K(+)-insensitive pyrophosphate-energized proton pump [candidate division WWE3 bacterium GW2011_GWC2_41_23]KKS10517.1 MAG: K(+)-insensitive pyrophosphate-energized proton pump [candidate division WWE3 bacterium GW2011_GWF2_41_45]KKS20288.1 MAG: K(+)-insensitive pyrophosphate-energized proton pump [candidate division WWE3 bacterium GW2011_GWE1_41_72]KKS27765.1 MAG: membrane-bound proton-translocating pyrophosphatase, K(+)-stimulated pyrophosphate-energized sodium pump [candidate division W